MHNVVANCNVDTNVFSILSIIVFVKMENSNCIYLFLFVRVFKRIILYSID